MHDKQWDEVTDLLPDEHRKERAYRVIRDRLPGRTPTRVWANFQFLTLEGAFFDVDALVLTPAGVFLVEFVTRRGQLGIGSDIWLHTKQNDQIDSLSSPYSLARKKAAELQDLLAQSRGKGANYKIPPIQPLVFVTEPEVSVDIDADARTGVVFHPDRSETDADALPSVITALSRREGPGLEPLSGTLDKAACNRFETVLERAGLERVPDNRPIGDYRLGELLDTTEVYQDYLAEHVSNGIVYRARIFRGQRGASDAELERIQEAARREYEILSPLDHDGILPAVDHLSLEETPTVFFEHPADAIRLDHFMARQRRVKPSTRYAILEQVAEAVQYAHEHKVIHRAINPRSVLVVPGEKEDRPGVRLLNWHTGRKDNHETGTRHVSHYLHETSKTFLAPELKHSPSVGEPADVFGLGALAYFLFTDRPPGPDIQTVIQRLAARGGLRPAVDKDDIGPELDELVYDATRSAPDKRLASTSEFIEALSAVREQVVTLNYDLTDPLEAAKGDRLGPYKVEKRLGTGSTSAAFEATTEDERTVVLKIAKSDAHESRLEAEAEALEAIDAELVVDLLDVTVLGGRRTLVLQSAGDTLLNKLREHSALSLYDQMRYGEDLCQILVELEDANVFHRDIKPSNLGVARPRPGSTTLHLMLFDFSLKGVAVDSVDVGTRVYRDPFLGPGGRNHWDVYADRYSAAVVLHEMVTQRLPRWGDSHTNPLADAEAALNIETERLPAPIRDGLDDFFRRALARDVEDRFDTARAMLESWREIYAKIVSTDHDDADQIGLDRARPDTKLTRLKDVSEAMRDAFDGIGISTVAELVEDSTQDIHFGEGLAADLKNGMLDLHQRLAEQFPAIAGETPDEVAAASARDYYNIPVEEIYDKLRDAPKDLETDREVFAEMLSGAFAADDLEEALPWRSVEAMADRTPLETEQFSDLLQTLFDKWRRKRVLPPLRDDIERLVDQAGGIIEASALAREVLGDRGSALDGDRRLACAAAVTRAAVETELADDDPRINRMRAGRQPGGEPSTFIATRSELFDILPELGDTADELAGRGPIASSDRAFGDLAAVFDQAGFQPPARRRLLDLAAAASTNAAVSSQNEIYPRDLQPVRALNLCANLLMRRAPLGPEDVARTVRERYPEAPELPGHPQLEHLLDTAGIGLEWDPSANEGIGAYDSQYDRTITRLAVTRSTAGTSERSLFDTSSVPHNRREERCHEFLKRLDIKSDDGGFFSLTVRPRLTDRAEDFLADRFDLTVVSVDAIVADVLRERSQAAGVDWQLLLEADAPDAPEPARRNFVHFLKGEEVIDRVYDRITDAGDRLLLTDAGLLGHWNDLAGSMRIIERLRDRTRTEGPSLVWLLAPSQSARDTARPRLDGQAVAVDDGDYGRVPSILVGGEGAA